MAGIADVQPKSVAPFTPMVGEVSPVATQDAVQKLVEGFRSGYITTKDIMQRNDALTNAKQNAELQVAKEAVSPEAIAARKESARLVAEKAAYERDTMLGKEAEDLYIKYNRVLYGPDGKPDHEGMKEVGLQYGDMERLLKYSQAGTTIAQTKKEIVNNQLVETDYNIYGQDITQRAGKRNAILEAHQKNEIKASTFLLHNTKEPSGEGESRLGGLVEPKSGAAAPASVVGAGPIVDAPAAPMVTAVVPFPDRGVIQAPAPVAAAAPVVVEPKVVPSAPEEKPMYTPGEGRPVGVDAERLKLAHEFRKNAEGSEFVKNWSEKSAIIGAFRATSAAYASKPKVTTVLDRDLATQAIFLSTPSAGGGMRGMQDLKAVNLAEAAPLIEKIYHIPAKLLGTEQFSEDTRNRLIQATERKAQELERIARGTIASTAQQISELGMDPNQILFGPEKGLLTGGNSGSVSGAPATGGAVSIPVTLSSGRKFTMTVR